jgi:hypothetical protein
LTGATLELNRHTRSRPLLDPRTAIGHEYAKLYQRYLARAALCE